MDKLRYVGHDEPLTTEQGQYIREKAVFAARRTFVARKLFAGAVRKIDSGAQTFGYDTLSEVSNAVLDFSWPGRESQDIVNLARTTVPIPNLHKEFEINKLDLASSRMSGEPLNTSTAESAAYKVATLEDSLLLDGYSADGTTYEINGLYNAAGNDYSSAASWSTPTNIQTSILGAKALLMADNIMPPYNLTVNPAQFNEAQVFIGDTAVMYIEWIEKVLQGGDIFVSPAISDGNALMSKANPEGMFEYVLAEDLTVETELLDLQHGNNLFGKVYLRGLPVVYDPNALCKLSNI